MRKIREIKSFKNIIFIVNVREGVYELFFKEKKTVLPKQSRAVELLPK